MFKKIFVLIVVLSGVLFVSSLVLAAEPKGYCSCLTDTLQEEVFEETKTACDNYRTKNPAITGCVWENIGEAGCFCDSCKIKIFNTDTKIKQVAKPQNECTGDITIVTHNCFGCEWYDPGVESGCFCSIDVPVVGSVKISAPLEFAKCNGDVLTDSGITLKNCAWKNKPQPTDPSSGDSSPGGGAGSSPSASPSVGGTSSAPPPTTISLENPLGAGPERLDLRLILGEIIGKVMGIAGALILLVFLYGGFLWLTAAGNPEHVKKGTQAMLWAVVGLFIIFASYGMLSLVFKAMGTKGSGYNPWGVEGVTKDDAVKANAGCYCVVKDPKTGAMSPAKNNQFDIKLKENCGDQTTPDGFEISQCKWETFTKQAPTSTSI